MSDKKYSFILPGDGLNLYTNIKLLDLIKNYPEFFYDDFKITAVFGCPSNCYFNGGGLNTSSPIPVLKMREELNWYKYYGINSKLTFTNALVEERDTYDRYFNAILREYDKPGNSVIYNNDLVKKYVKANYKNFEFTKSITSGLKFDEVNKYSEEDLTVLPLIYNSEDKILSKLEHPENIEILVNETCVPTCPFKYTHYRDFNKYKLYLQDYYDDCFFDYHRVKENYAPHYIFYREQLDRFVNFGIDKFKISGRSMSPQAMVSLAYDYCKFFVLPEYRYFVGNYILPDEDKDYIDIKNKMEKIILEENGFAN